jgi:hypothetical protein
VVYSVGTQVYKNFPGHGFYWGEITVSKHDKDGFYYEIDYSDGDLETITDEPDSVMLLHELHVAVTAAQEKPLKRNLQDTKIAANDRRKRTKIA